jgi:hypothetical protein
MRTDRQLSAGSRKVPIVVPDIPVIHSLVTENFASATRGRSAWCSGDRDGSPRLTGRPATARGRGRRRKDRSPPAGNGKNFRVLAGVSREEAPEEVIASRATRLLGFFGTSVSKAGRKSGCPKKGRGTSGSFGPERLPVFGLGISRSARPGQSNDQRAFGPRSRVDQPGSSQEGIAGWKATPELVSQDRERVGRPQGQSTKPKNTGRSFARRSGGWQQCRPPFLYVRCPSLRSCTRI